MQPALASRPDPVQARGYQWFIYLYKKRAWFVLKTKSGRAGKEVDGGSEEVLLLPV